MTLVPVSPHLLTRPADWSPNIYLTGHWAEEPPTGGADEELEEFSANGDFVYAGFGSMKAGDAVKRGGMVVAAARRNGLKTLVAEGWGGIGIPAAARGGDILVRESLPHHLVLPRAAAAIHHGGAGTVHTVARAGIPSVVVPFIADQPFWGRVLQRGGLAPEPVPYRNLTADRLAVALARTKALRAGAARMGERLRDEDGAAIAVDVLEGRAGYQV